MSGQVGTHSTDRSNWGGAPAAGQRTRPGLFRGIRGIEAERHPALSPLEEDGKMSPTRHEFEYGRLQNLSFTQLFQLLVAMAHCHSALCQEALIVGRASDCCRRRLAQPAYAAVFLADHRGVRSEKPTEPGNQKRSKRLRR
jgi:hypothetical protein